MDEQTLRPASIDQLGGVDLRTKFEQLAFTENIRFVTDDNLLMRSLLMNLFMVKH